MLVDFDLIPDNSRIWIYSSHMKLDKQKKLYIIKKISNHLKEWKAHDVPLKAAITIKEDHFIIIALDESQSNASGCSIDSLQRLIQEIESELSISLLNRLNVFYKLNNEVLSVPLNQLKSVADSETFFFDLTINKKSELSSYFKPIKDSWCKNYI